jgi:hypothetical protein
MTDQELLEFIIVEICKKNRCKTCPLWHHAPCEAKIVPMTNNDELIERRRKYRIYRPLGNWIMNRLDKEAIKCCMYGTKKK